MNKKASKFSPEVRERAVRLVREQRSEHPSMWAAVESIAPMMSRGGVMEPIRGRRNEAT
ncbi:hypothetical protein [Burkholderia sp. Bp9143]|uniref:hypothetical protein n=1 Tax=Burkholderia sp. Bp9143 TaxID=2184574 RepID=UPI001623A7AF|nr:hypothetical protein [Burkholderia sp. Bp9143]